MNKVKVWIYKDEEGIMRPMAGIWIREGNVANFMQPELDKFMKRMKNIGSIVEAEIIEIK